MVTVEQNEMTGWDVVDSTGYSIAERASEANADELARRFNEHPEMEAEITRLKKLLADSGIPC